MGISHWCVSILFRQVDMVLGINLLQEHGHYKEKFKLVVGKVLNESDIFPKEDRNFGLCNL